MLFGLFRIRFVFVVAWTAAAFMTGMLYGTSEPCRPHFIPAPPGLNPAFIQPRNLQ